MGILVLLIEREPGNKHDHWAQIVSSSLGELSQPSFFFFLSVIDMGNTKDFFDCLWSACSVLSVLRCADFMPAE